MTLKVQGYAPTDMIDWPDTICSGIWLGGCNLDCVYCHNPELKKRVAGHYEFDGIVKKAKKHARWIDKITITGGEPFAHPRLFTMMRDLKAVGMRINVHTNGTFPEKLERAVEEGLVDRVAMDVKTSFDKYADPAIGFHGDIADLRRSVRFILDATEDGRLSDHEFRTTLAEGLVDEDDIRAIVEEIRGARVFYLQGLQFDFAADPEPFLPLVMSMEKAKRLRDVAALVVPTELRNY